MPHADGPTTDGEQHASARQLLDGFAANWGQDRVRLVDIIDALEDRVYGLVFLALAIPNMIPGVAIILGVPLIIISAQLMIGMPKPKLPQFIGHRSMSITDFRSWVAKADPWLERGERLLKRRITFFFSPTGDKLLGLIALVMSIILTLPIWGANFLPSLTIALIGIAMIEHDGLVALGSLVTAVLSGIVAFGVIYGAIKLGLYLIFHAFG